jgi:MFS family permease
MSAMPPSSLVPPTDRLVTRPFVIVTTATFSFFLFVGMMAPILPRFIENELGGNGTAIGLAIAAFAVAAIAMRPVIGWIGDVAGRKVLMIGGSVLAAAAVMLHGFVPSLAVLLPLRAFAGVGEAALFVGAATLIADLSPPTRRAEGASFFSVAVFGGLGVGPVIGEAVLGDGRYTLTFVAASMFCLLAALIALAAPSRPPRPVSAVPVKRGFHPKAFPPGIVLAAGIASVTALFAFVPTYVDRLGMGGASGVFILYSVICLVIRIVFAKLPERLGLTRSVGAALSALALGLAIVAGIPSALGLYAGTAVMSLGIALLYPALMATAVNMVSEAERSKALATFTMFFEVGTILGGLVLGPVVAASSERGAFVGGVAFALIGLVLLRSWLVPLMQRSAAAAVVPSFVPAPVAGD